VFLRASIPAGGELGPARGVVSGRDLVGIGGQEGKKEECVHESSIPRKWFISNRHFRHA